MMTVSKSATLETLGLPPGDHVVHFHVGVEVISYEVAGGVGALPVSYAPTHESFPGSKGSNLPDLKAYQQRVAAARAQLVAFSWATTEEAMLVLREGEVE